MDWKIDERRAAALISVDGCPAATVLLLRAVWAVSWRLAGAAFGREAAAVGTSYFHALFYQRPPPRPIIIYAGAHAWRIEKAAALFFLSRRTFAHPIERKYKRTIISAIFHWKRASGQSQSVVPLGVLRRMATTLAGCFFIATVVGVYLPGDHS
ncbi:hypothetical protein [Nitrososphaera sp.]|uniref:hypothetical protein n=1 Tax=Nitrososphaera sp. TaxID=1971748 RepID=UPI00307DC677